MARQTSIVRRPLQATVLWTVVCVRLIAIGALGAGWSLAQEPIAPASVTDTSLIDTSLIDEELLSQWSAAGVQPSPPATDTEFLRRLMQTSIGQLPTPDEVREFARDMRPDKRARKIEELLGHRLHAAMWATRFSEWTGNSVDTLAAEDASTKLAIAQMWHEWLRVRFEKNLPYDQLIRSLLTATSRNADTISDWLQREYDWTAALRAQQATTLSDRPTLDLFWRRQLVQNEYPAREMAERVASSLLGVRLNCARCHDHPFDRWTKRDYEAFVRIFEQVRHDMSPELRAEVASRLAARRQRLAADPTKTEPPLAHVTEVYLAALPSGLQTTAPKVLGGPELSADLPDYRVGLVDWMVDAENETFARNLVNRCWAHYFGEGLVEPWDNLSSAKESPRTKLLSKLARRFIGSGFDIRALEQMILNSRAWQLSSIPHESQPQHEHGFARCLVRLPTAETFVDMWHGATGIEYDLGAGPLRGLKAIEVGSDRLPGNRWDKILKQFGQPVRSETCDCSVRNRPSARQLLTLMSDPELLADLSKGRLTALVASDINDDAVIDELFLATLSRWPSAEEREVALKAIDQQDRVASFENILASLLTTQEFVTIH